MNKIAKITGWVLGILGIGFGVWCLASGSQENSTSVDVLLKYAYVLMIAAVVVLLGLTIVKAATNDPKGLVKAIIFLVIAVAFVGVVYALSAGSPALNVKQQPSEFMLKMSDTMMLLTAILGVGAVCAILFGVITNAIKSK